MVCLLLELKSIQKRFGGVTALKNGNLQVEAGKVHLLMGENGAGKSTMMKIVAGMYQPDGGEILWRGERVKFAMPADASRQGIAMVHQESLLAPHLTVAENIFLGREHSAGLGLVNRSRMLQDARKLIADLRFPIHADWRVQRLSPAGKQLVEICRAVQHGSSLLIFDEPTSSLSESETREVFRVVKELSGRGMGVIYITHRLEELRTVGDSVTVLRDGETVHSGALSNLSLDQLIRHMVGREVSSLYKRTHPEKVGEPLLRVENLSRRPLLHGVNLEVKAGEIVGLAGLVGAGRTELCRAIFGIDKPDEGTVTVCGKVLAHSGPREAVAAGLALIPEDRQKTGLATGLSIAANLTLPDLPAISTAGFVSLSQEKARAATFGNRLRIRMAGPQQIAGRLSGGNQQKIVIAKWVARGARVFLFDEPTRGIDVGAKAEVFEVMDELARNGAAILMVSSELPEIVQVADRILVMRQGKLSGELPGGSTQEEIMRLAAFETEPGTIEENPQ